MRIFTAGYEGVALDEFLRRLLAAGIAVVADVRELPLSRKKGFSKTALAASLASVGIGYLHLRELGCPKAVRHEYREDGDWAAYTAAFLQHLAQQKTAIDALALNAAAKPIALLCYEADFSRCHRTFVARAVAERNFGGVAHITADGIVAA